jgi:HD-like signal output (HDOD) protein
MLTDSTSAQNGRGVQPPASGETPRPVLVVAAGSAPMRRLLAQRLGTCGVDIVEAVDVDEAVAALTKFNPASLILSSDLGCDNAGLRLARHLGLFACRRRLPIVLLVEKSDEVERLGPLAPVVHVLEVSRFRSLNVLARTVLNLHHRAVERVKSLSNEELSALENMSENQGEVEELNAHQAFLDDAMDLFGTVVKKIRDGRLPGPVMPELLGRVQELFADSNTGVREVSLFIEQNQVLAARLLSLANSAVYSRGTVIREVDKAVSRLGTEECASMMRAVAALGFVRGTHEGLRALIQESLRRAYCVGLFAEHLARIANHPRPSLLQTAGLFHNVGATFLLYTVALMHEKGEVTEINTRALATTAKSKADELNRMVCRNMRLPADIEKIYEFDSEEAKDPLLQLVHRAMWISNFILDRDVTSVEHSVEAELLGLSKLDLDAINQRMPVMLEALSTYTQSFVDA